MGAAIGAGERGRPGRIDPLAMATADLEPAADALDTTVRLVTPERITFQYPLAGPFRRAAAYLLDLGVLRPARLPRAGRCRWSSRWGRRPAAASSW